MGTLFSTMDLQTLQSEVIEVKKDMISQDSYPQVLAQAAASLKIRGRNKRGVDGDGGPVFFILTNGFEWVFHRVSIAESQLNVMTSARFSLNMSHDVQSRQHLNEDQAKRVYSCLAYVVESALKSSPRASAVTREASLDVELDAAAQNLGNLSLDHQTINM
jgi:hypothetical protein